MGLAGKYDLLHIPRDAHKPDCSLGYAFINKICLIDSIVNGNFVSNYSPYSPYPSDSARNSGSREIRNRQDRSIAVQRVNSVTDSIPITNFEKAATPKAALNEAHGTLSTKTTRGEWNAGHCSRAECNLGYNHPGPCSDITVPTVQGNPARSTRGARMRAIAEENEPTEEPCEEAEEEVSDTDERTIDALLATSYSITSPQMLEDDTSTTMETMYGTCIDALSATVDLDELHSPIVNGSQSKPKTGTFDMTLPLPTDLKSAMESPNWDVPMGYKYAVDRECNAWIKQKVLQGTSWDQIKQDLHALNMRLLFTIKTDKKNCFQRAKLRILILGHQYAVKQGEHYFENYSQTVRWPNIRAICAQACINGFTYAKQIDTGAAFLFEANELGTQVLVRVFQLTFNVITSVVDAVTNSSQQICEQNLSGITVSCSRIIQTLAQNPSNPCTVCANGSNIVQYSRY